LPPPKDADDILSILSREGERGRRQDARDAKYLIVKRRGEKKKKGKGKRWKLAIAFSQLIFPTALGEEEGKKPSN